MYRCCIFDLDGTLVDSVKALAYVTNLTLEKYGLGPVETDMFYQFVGDGFKKQVERALLYAGDKELVYYEDALVEYIKYFDQHCLYQVTPYEGIKELLTYLKEKQIKITVFSNKPHKQAVDTVEGIFGKGYFDMIQGEKESIPKKPNQAGALLVAQTMETEISQCLYIGDTDTDMQTGRNAGMDTVGVTWGFRDQEELEKYSPKFIVDHPREIQEIVEK